MPDSPHNQAAGENPLDVRFGEILNDFLDRKARGEAVSEAKLYAEYPEFADELREALEVVGEIRPSRADIEELITRGILVHSSDAQYLAELDPYKITGFIGRGGMGVVLKAYEESLDRTVALKLLRPELAQDKVALGRFTREAKAAAALQHPNIITVHAVGEYNGTHYLSMEYIEGPTLTELIRDRGALPTETIRQVFRQILSGLAAAHDAGLIHRDIKPSNVLLAGTQQRNDHGQSCSPSEPRASARADVVIEPRASARAVDGHSRSRACSVPSEAGAGSSGGSSLTVKITDFGLARMASAQTRITLPDSILGTPEYMSPEQARGDEDIDHRTDLYSAGVVLYEMLTGAVPFKADSPSAVIHQILHDNPPDPRSISETADPHLASLALRLMAKAPEDRFSSATQAMTALEAGERICSPAKRRRLARQLVVAAVLAAVACAGLWVTALVLRPRVIEDVRIEQYGGKPTTNIQVKHAGESTWTDFHPFPDEVNAITGAEGVDSNGDGEMDTVVVGLDRPLSGKCLFAFASDQEELWALDLSDPHQWPDCLSRAWGCQLLTMGDLDGESGDELVVVASDIKEYPTGISIIDPCTGEVKSTFWNMGNIAGILVDRDYFGEDQPGIIAWGLNNKLDGFGHPPPPDYEPPLGEDEPRTRYDIVSVVMVLDPGRMNGLSPPRSNYLADLQGDPPFAYAFLNLPPGGNASYVPEGETNRVLPKVDEQVEIREVRIVRCGADGSAGPRLECAVAGGHKSDARSRSGALIQVDKNLEWYVAVPDSGELIGSTEAYWAAYWCPIVKSYEYVGD